MNDDASDLRRVRSLEEAASVPRVRPLGVLWASLRRDWQNAWSYRMPFAWRAVEISFGLFMVYFMGKLIGNRLSVVTDIDAKGGYFAFALVGAGIVAILHASMTTFASRIRSDQTTGVLEAMLSSPTPPWLTIVSSAAYGLLFTMLLQACSLIAAVAFLGLRFHTTWSGFGVFAAGFVASVVLFTAVGLGFAGFTIVFKRGHAGIGFLISAISVLGGVAFPLQLLPKPLRVIGEALPFTWSVSLIRGTLLYGEAPYRELVGLIIASLVIVPLVVWLFGKALDRARREGTLGQY